MIACPEVQPFVWLQSVEDPTIAFVIVDPLLIIPDYLAQVHPEDIESLDIQDPTEAKEPWEVLKTADFPTLMIELGHLSNPVERRLLLSRAYWEQVSAVLVEAVDEITGR